MAINTVPNRYRGMNNKQQARVDAQIASGNYGSGKLGQIAQRRNGIIDNQAASGNYGQGAIGQAAQQRAVQPPPPPVQPQIAQPMAASVPPPAEVTPPAGIQMTPTANRLQNQQQFGQRLANGGSGQQFLANHQRFAQNGGANYDQNQAALQQRIANGGSGQQFLANHPRFAARQNYLQPTEQSMNQGITDIQRRQSGNGYGG